MAMLLKRGFTPSPYTNKGRGKQNKGRVLTPFVLKGVEPQGIYIYIYICISMYVYFYVYIYIYMYFAVTGPKPNEDERPKWIFRPPWPGRSAWRPCAPRGPRLAASFFLRRPPSRTCAARFRDRTRRFQPQTSYLDPESTSSRF